jgi:hypothetical protein
MSDSTSTSGASAPSSLATSEAKPVLVREKSTSSDGFGGGSLWIGQHSADQDILVFDPAESDASAELVSLYSLTQHRVRRFPRAMALKNIKPLTDEMAFARAKKEYSQRATLRSAHEEAQTEAQAQRMDQVRENIVSAHRRYIEALGLAYVGVNPVNPDAKPGRVTKCHACGIILDGFVSATCGICSRAVCSCGGCACGKVAKNAK